MAKTMVLTTVLVITMLINGMSAQKLIVGDGSGWTFPPSAGFYDTWAAKQHFAVGDTLVFEFTSGHTVATVTSKEAYDKCDASLDKNAVIVTKGPYEVSLTSAGQYYYLCTVGAHCTNGQKFAATVSATHAGSSNPTPSSPSPPTPSSPSPPTPPTKDSAGALASSSIFAILIAALVLALLY
ncbi:hypothetical protein RND81_07G109600 [Saponaria officinalis]|uniref:Phytocyanin domain-containing protein n=1 Tax=Saponaria officinalis TaxID=3572 RepID=A0AAW1JQI2_SAPOF